MAALGSLAGALSPWSDLYSSSTAVSTTVTTVHIVSLLLSGGLAIAADRSVLRLLARPESDRAAALPELRDVHRPVLAALSVLILSGILMAAADVETFVGSPLFWCKMGLVALLLANGAAMVLTERRLAIASGAIEDRWRWLGWHARTSLALWVCLAVVGTVLTNAA